MSYRLLSSAAALALTAGVAQADYTLHVIHINDLHSRIEPINRFDSTCSAEDNAEGKCFGGVARVKTMIDQLRSELDGQNVIVLDAGDQYQGSLMYTTYKGDVEAEMMEKIGFDVMAVGNHEFDDGDEGLLKLIDNVSFPVISGNLDVSQSNILADKVQNHVVLEVGGEKIGIVSALAVDTVETSSPSDAVIFQNEIDSISADVATLTAEGVTKIIALTHVGLPKDLEIAAAVPGLDAVVGGHSHTYLSASDPDRAGAYPTFASQEDGTLVPVVQAYAYSKYVGHLELNFDDAGNLTYASGDTILLDASVEEDAEIVARVAELAGPIEEMKTRIVAEAAEAIEGSRDVCRAMECPMGNLVADAMLDRVQDQGVQIAIQNGGGLRSSIDAGEVTMGEVLSVLPFQNTLSTFEVTGAQILAALENGVSQVEEGAGRFPQVAGMSFTVDLTQAPGSRISNVMVGDAALDPEATYGAVSNNYVRNGGDGYRMFRDAMNAYDYGPDLADVTAEYLAKVGPYQPFTDGRITVNK
ncbi:MULTISPECIES: bifunctional metallophosphatase/5'-nucleotidase [Marivita]|uniref:5'-nucleotidase C-terminal domain-containing protein n=1 Tax=Marivita cryptomonadis TaxID=505252 RepID=A0A9Q2RZ19_9RHOB|nr:MULTISPECIES: bifunctional metallophosphatase/5'-nucleotidase [Marivita]MCR9169905.1 5'-nucleotidase/apyrase family protein [Paracoccaceae bacterium]MBM2321047.1 5'-nucleotidase C-terminal domain-containing protein [Marivita cryptomonadis]MBM2330628.1 5'-nucleotidase C-terminal domain-containing protein [Marivita cryptomonadis]MBM2340214.1 5'-nucleotidase C-terminal domain-containing protein [Marivita cryptomonadis]MBM2344876.1 5'-nucleotidase C-terminal domain-containing protein [Marivita 